MESVSKNITSRLSSRRHKVANQEPRLETGRDFYASGTQRMQLSGPRLREPASGGFVGGGEMRQER